jgi:Uma2 family endonuclease
MGMAAPIYYTADMVRALPDDGNRYEVVHGELLVTPAPRLWHQEVCARLLTALRAYVDREAMGVVLASPADISWGRDILVQPDLFVVPVEEARLQDWSEIRHLLLAVEILSPSSTRADRFTKRRLYQERDVPAYWVVDGDTHVVEMWRPDVELPVIERDRLTWQPSGAVRPFIMDLSTLFRPI